MHSSITTTTAIGRPTFDGLGRQLSVETGGRITLYRYTAGQLPPSANTLADGRRVEFSYVSELDNLVRQILPEGEKANDFTYDAKLAQISSSTGLLGQQSMSYTAGGKPKTDTWTVDDTSHVTTWRHSLGGLLLGFEDSAKVDHQRYHDSVGRLCQVVVGSTTCTITYDDFSRPQTYTTLDSSNDNQLVQTLSYDSIGREHTRTFAATVAGVTRTQVQTLIYTDLDQVKTRIWKDDTREGKETFTYDLLGRLVSYSADTNVAPQDPFGNRVIGQVLSLNALDGYDNVRSTFADGSSDEATYHYRNAEDPCQVSAITHSHDAWPKTITLEYDACGRLAKDSLGRTLTWDSQDRVTRVEYQGKVCTYGYDPSGNLCDRTIDNILTRSFHSAGQLTHEQRGTDVLRLVSDAGQLFALDRLSDGVRQGNTTLLGCDAQGSVRIEADQTVRSRHYTAHGAEPGAPDAADNPYGFAGERREPLTGWYIPGGYRPYDPLLMIILAPDSESPFGRGGINSYAYCAGDPVNRVDPDGHSWNIWTKFAVAIAVGVLAFVPVIGPGIVGGYTAALTGAAILSGAGTAALTAATTAAGVAAIASGTLTIVAASTGAASAVLLAKDADSQAGKALGVISDVARYSAMVVGSANMLNTKVPGYVAQIKASQSASSLPRLLRASPLASRSPSLSISPTSSNASQAAQRLNRVDSVPSRLGGKESFEMSTPSPSTSGGPSDIAPLALTGVGNSSDSGTPANLPQSQNVDAGTTHRVFAVTKRPNADAYSPSRFGDGRQSVRRRFT